jgi:Transcriptional regulator
MHIDVSIALKVNGSSITARQIEVLEAVGKEGSKTAAARKLKLSVPVVHRYISSVEESTGVKMIASTPSGTKLTDDGRSIVNAARMMRLRCSERRARIACTPVTEELTMSVISDVKSEADLIISDDRTNMNSLMDGTADMILLDDPVHLFDLENFQFIEIGSMDMVHVDRGRVYMLYRYGAQRIAYMHLDASGVDYRIDGETMSLRDLMDSGKSFFVDEALLNKEGVKIRSATEPKLLRHTINAVFGDTSKIANVLGELVRRSK